jgi:tRNA (cytidine/uridine-2'-O-)-methyltransferase
MFAFSTRGKRAYDEADYRPGDAFLFGSETRGLPAELLSRLRADQVLRVPMRPGNRSLNLSNAAAVVLYEAWRRECFAGGQ